MSTTSDQTEVYKDLLALLPDVPEKDRPFATSLVDKFPGYNGWSAKQFHWAKEMLKQAVDPDIGKAKKEQVNLGKFTGVYKLFEKASSLKWPKLNLATFDNQYPVGLSVAGVKAKCPGTINVTDGKPFGENKWYGRIDAEGHFELSSPYKDTPEMMEIIGLLRMLSKDAHETAVKCGKMSGYCTFCNRPLKYDKSVAVGYGEKCAKNWGLHDKWKNAFKESGVGG